MPQSPSAAASLPPATRQRLAVEVLSKTETVSRANCWDNAVAESFLGTLKTELIHSRIFSTRVQAKTAIVEWIEVFYNRQHIHSTIGYLSPVQFEDNYWLSLDQNIAA